MATRADSAASVRALNRFARRNILKAMLHNFRVVGFVASLGCALAACNVPVTIEVGVGPFEYEVSAAQITIPDPLRETSTTPPTLRALPCDSDMACPQFDTGTPAIRCTN